MRKNLGGTRTNSLDICLGPGLGSARSTLNHPVESVREGIDLLTRIIVSNLSAGWLQIEWNGMMVVSKCDDIICIGINATARSLDGSLL